MKANLRHQFAANSYIAASKFFLNRVPQALNNLLSQDPEFSGNFQPLKNFKKAVQLQPNNK